MTTSRRTILALGAALAAGAFPAMAAEAWPSKMIRMVVAFPPGGPTDTAARVIAQELSTRLGQQVIVENRAGASGSVGTASVIKSPADGYTISMFGMPALIAPILFRNGLYDVRTDFTPVSTVYDLPMVLVVNPNVLPDVHSLQDLIAKSKEGPMHYTTPGAGSIGHLSMEQLKVLGNFKMDHVAYKGSAPAISDLLGGQVGVMFSDSIAAMPHIKSGRLRAIAVGTTSAKSFLPEVKAISEQGFPGFESSSWSGLIVPNGTPEAVVKRLDAELKVILATPAVQERIEKIGALAAYQPSSEMKTRLVNEYNRWQKVATEQNITAD